MAERLEGRTIDMDKDITYMLLGEHAEGTIEARADQQERLDEFTERVGSGEFHKEIPTGVAIPARCVDGRNIETGANPLAPNAAGGTETIFVADDLTTKRFAGKDGSTLAGYSNVVDMLQSANNPTLEVGGHTDTHAHDNKSGCGANDKLPEIYDFIKRKDDVLRSVAATLGVQVSDETHDLIVGNAAARTEFSAGAELFKELKNKAKEEYIDHLDGEHNEVVGVINKRKGTTLDRDALMEEFGPNYEAFNIDVWSFEEAARATSLSEGEIDQKVAAMVYYNLATTMVLAGKNLRVVVID